MKNTKTDRECRVYGCNTIISRCDGRRRDRCARCIRLGMRLE